MDARLYEREQPHVVRRCAVQRAKGQTSQILSFVGYHLILSSSPLHPLLSSLPRPFKSLRIPTSVPPHTTPHTSPPNTRPLKSALTACLLACHLPPPLTIRPTHLAVEPAFHQKAPPHPWSSSIPTIVPRPHTASFSPPTVRSSIVIRVPSTSTSNARAFPLRPIAPGGPRASPQSLSPTPVPLGMTPSAASH